MIILFSRHQSSLIVTSASTNQPEKNNNMCFILVWSNEDAFYSVDNNTLSITNKKGHCIIINNNNDTVIDDSPFTAISNTKVYLVALSCCISCQYDHYRGRKLEQNWFTFRCNVYDESVSCQWCSELLPPYLFHAHSAIASAENQPNNRSRENDQKRS